MKKHYFLLRGNMLYRYKDQVLYIIYSYQNYLQKLQY